jgi:hypothetical protein
MELYGRFLITLTIGLAGFGVVMTTLFETLLRDWDPSRALRVWWRTLTHSRSHASSIRAEDILEQLQTQRRDAYVSRVNTIDRRREALRGVSEAEARLAAPRAA